MRSFWNYRDRNEYLTFMVILLIGSIGSILCASVANADGTVGFTYSQIIDDKSLGVTGEYERELTERVTFEADGQLQTGDIYNGTLNTNFVFDIAAIDLKLLVENQYKGYDLDTLGRAQSVGLAFSVPIDNLNIDVGIGGVNSSPFDTPNAFDTLVSEGFSESDISGKGLDAVTPAPKGIPFKNGSALNAFMATGFEKGVFDIDIKAIIELLGEGDKMHQVNTVFSTNGTVAGLLITTSVELGLVSYQDAIHHEIATVTSVGFEF